jgi:DNA repair protein RecO (recombination protein O)
MMPHPGFVSTGAKKTILALTKPDASYFDGPIPPPLGFLSVAPLPIMVHTTRGIVLRTTAFGDTSLIATVYTRQFGLQQYIIKGARQGSKKGPGKAVFFQPAAMLDLVVYHNELKQLQYIRELNWAVVYGQILHMLGKNSVAVFMVELITKCIRQPEENPDLYDWLEDRFVQLDSCSNETAARFAIHFAWALAARLGFAVDGSYSADTPVLDLQEGCFIAEAPQHGRHLSGIAAQQCSQLISLQSANDAGNIAPTRPERRTLLKAALQFYEYHIPDFGAMKTVSVLEMIF